MGKIYTSQIHKSENASIWYGGIVVHTIREIRRSIESLKKSKKADQYVMGGIHALRKLLEDEESCSNLAKAEVKEWIAILEEWYKKASRYIPKDIQEDFKKQLDEDLEIILDKSSDLPEYSWRKESLERQIILRVENQEVKDLYYQKTEIKHPVELGNSLNEYLKKCLSNLLDDKSTNESIDPPVQKVHHNSLNISITRNETDYALLIDEFEFYNTNENREQDIHINAYDLEDAIKSNLVSTFKFDCESSLFFVSSKKLDSLQQIIEVLLSLKTTDIIK